SERSRGVQRDEQGRRTGRIHAKEVSRGYPDDGERRAVDEHRLANRARVSAKTAAPVPMADHGHGRCTEAIVIPFDAPARRRQHCETTEKTARYELNVGEFGLSLNDEIESRPSEGE